MACYFYNKSIDNNLAASLGQNLGRLVLPEAVHIYRLTFDEFQKKNGMTLELIDAIDLSNAELFNKYVEDLTNYIKYGHRLETSDYIKSAKNNALGNMRKLFNTMANAEVRQTRAFDIAFIFNKLVNRMHERYNKGKSQKNSRPIEDFIIGFKEGDKYIGGVANLLELTYNAFVRRSAEALKKGDTGLASRYADVVNNWGALLVYSKSLIKDYTGIDINMSNTNAVKAEEFEKGSSDQELYDQTLATKESYQRKKERESTLETIGSITRRFIYSTYLSDSEGKNKNLDDFEVPIPINPIKVHRDLKIVTYGAIDEASFLDLFEKRMNANLEEYAYLGVILNEIKFNSEALTQLYNDLKRDWTPYSIVSLKIVTKGGETNVVNRTKELNKNDNDLKNAINAFSRPSSIRGYRSMTDDAGILMDKEYLWNEVDGVIQNAVDEKGNFISLAASLYSKYKINNINGKRELLWDYGLYTKYGLKERINFLNDLLGRLNINIPYDAIKITAKNDTAINKIANRVNNIVYLMKKLSKSAPKAVYKYSFKSILRGNSEYAKEITTSMSRIIDIIKEQLPYDTSGEEASITYKDENGKYNKYYSHTLPSYLGQFVSKILYYIREDDKKGLKTFLENNYLNSDLFRNKTTGEIYNPFILEMLDACSNPFQSLMSTIGQLYKVTRELGGFNTNFDNYSQSQFAVSMWANFFAPEELKKYDTSGDAYANYTIFVTGDSGALKYITARKYDFETVVQKLVNLAKVENARRETIREFDKFCEDNGFEKLNSSENLKDEYTLLDFLNKDYRLNKKHSKGKYYNIAKSQGTEEAIRQYIYDAVDAYKDTFIKRGIISKNGKAIKINSTLYNPSNIDAKMQEFVSNHILATISLIQLMTIDPGFYKGVIDLQKRYKEIHSSGNTLSTSARDFDGNLYARDNKGRVSKYLKTIYFKLAKGSYSLYNPEVLKVLTSRYGEGSSIVEAHKKGFPIADGQSIRTLFSLRKVLGMAGRWSRAQENAYLEIEEIRTALKNRRRRGNGNEYFTKEELTRLYELQLQFQPLKPFMFTHEKVNIEIGKNTGVYKTVLIPVQYKCSEMVVIPELLDYQSPLRAMVEYMEDNGIDVACEDSAIKVGIWGSFNFHDSTINDTAGFKEMIKNTAKVHELDYDDYRIVSNVPEHLYNSRQVGTQLRKIFFNMIYSRDNRINAENDSKYASYILDENGNAQTICLESGKAPVHLNTLNLISLYNSLVSSDMVDNYTLFKKVISSETQLANMLMQNALRNDRGVEATIDGFDIDLEDGRFMNPLFEGTVATENIAYLLSAFRRLVNQQRTSGGSLVLATSLGLTGFRLSKNLKYILEKDKNGNEKTGKDANILAAECEVSADILTYKSDSGFEYQVDVSKYIDERGEFILSESGKKDRYGEPLTKIEEDYPDILSIVAYRVPTEREYSMLNLRIKRITPRVFGGIIKVPLPHTLISGFDFDIDKLYFMRKSYTSKRTYQNLSDETIKRAWEIVWGMKYTSKGYVGTSIPYMAAKAARDRDLALQRKVKKIVSKGPARRGKRFLIVEYVQEDTKNLHKYLEECGFDKNALFEEALEKMGISRDSWGIKDTITNDYDYNKTPFLNTKDARDNLFFDLIRARLEDPDTLESRMIPGGYDGLSKDAVKIKKLLYGTKEELVDGKTVETPDEPLYSYSNPETMLTFTEQNQVAEKVIGIMANHSSNAYYTGIMKKFSLKSVVDDKGIKWLPFLFAGKYYDSIIDKRNPDGTFTDGSEIVALLLAAAVDAVKDPVLPYLNINLTTANIAALLARLGYTGYEIGLLLNLPIVKEVCDKVNDEKIHIRQAIWEVFNKYKDEKNAKDTLSARRNSAKNINPSEEQLRLQIIDFRDDVDGTFYNKNSNFQLSILGMLSQISNTANALGDFVKITKFTSANSIPSSVGDILELMDAVEKRGSNVTNFFDVDSSLWGDTNFKDKLVRNEDNGDLISSNPQKYLDGLLHNTFAFEQCMYDLIKEFIHQLCKNKLFPYESDLYTQMRNNLYDLNVYGTNDGPSIEQLHKDIPLMYLVDNTVGYFNPTSMIEYIDLDGKKKKVTMKKYYTEIFPLLFEMFSEESGIFTRLNVLSRLVNTGLVGLLNNPYLKTIYELVPSYEDIYRNSSVQNSIVWDIKQFPPEVLRDLLLYNLYKFGNNYTYRGFMQMIPTSVKHDMEVQRFITLNGEVQEYETTTYRDLMYELVDAQSPENIKTLSSRLLQFVLNNLNNERFVVNISKDSPFYLTANARFKTIEKEEVINGNKVTRRLKVLTMNNIFTDPDKEAFLVRIEDTNTESKEGEEVTVKKALFPPVIKLDNTYYIASNEATKLHGSNFLFNSAVINIDKQSGVPQPITITYTEVPTSDSVAAKLGYSRNFSLANLEEGTILGYNYTGNLAVSLSADSIAILLRNYIGEPNVNMMARITLDVLKTYKEQLTEEELDLLNKLQLGTITSDIGLVFRNLLTKYTTLDQSVLNENGEETTIC